MKFTRTTLRLTAAALGAVALFSAAAIAGVSRSEDMMSSGILTFEQAAPAAQPNARPAERPQNARHP